MLNLYTTSHCHLCEEALGLVLLVCNIEQVSRIEISENDGLMIIYGTRIPVLQRLDTMEELDWPFNAQKLQQFLST